MLLRNLRNPGNAGQMAVSHQICGKGFALFQCQQMSTDLICWGSWGGGITCLYWIIQHVADPDGIWRLKYEWKKHEKSDPVTPVTVFRRTRISPIARRTLGCGQASEYREARQRAVASLSLQKSLRFRSQVRRKVTVYFWMFSYYIVCNFVQVHIP